MNKARVGVKYCGGCRANYDRGAAANRAERLTQEEHPAAAFAPVEQGERYAAVLAVCGCKTACPSLDGFTYEKAVFVTEDGEEAEAAKTLAEVIAKNREA